MTSEVETSPLLSPSSPPSPPSRRRLSTSNAARHKARAHCQPLPSSVDALDLHFSSPLPALAALRQHVLSYLADLETRLSLLESPISAESLKTKGESTVDEARAWARTALEMLSRIRTDVCAHLPELHRESTAVEDFVKAHLPDVRARLEDVRSSIEPHHPLQYIPTLSDHLQSLQTHLASVDVPHSLRESYAYLNPHSSLSEMLDRFRASELVTAVSADIKEGEDMLERAAMEVAKAVRRSVDGSRLIHYADLPEQWRNNRFVSRGYRFIPLHKWPLILSSVFAFHNETANIHTHFIPFVLWSLNLIPVNFFSATLHTDTPELFYTYFALLCLFTSTIWHTMSCLAHPEGMEMCARIDYIGIGWLISASVGTVVYYGFQGHDNLRVVCLSVCALMGIMGTICPFMSWFNDLKYRNYRIGFFVGLTAGCFTPLAVLAYLYTFTGMLTYIQPALVSVAVYAIGLVFYATHFPECVLSRPGTAHWLDWLGGGSHAIWHVCIVLGMSLHRAAMEQMKDGPAAVLHSLQH